ncbi:ParB/RepB/Spo0J family partition protein [Streptomyces aureoverticillatus]|uniref:ParB/RepB/Spo0J family partition protein n=1 Tax=Streptomyces aureoverticillatus TaxID=66871 RepID=UPI0013DCC638|nr:ParB/RepB/Spo0J family partition protein [Streptomyces aureoverticillatus]QIB49527.1 ParB/RepB/Spo0J family partition protein [Streptomyces aureoverticillatus]
MSKAEQLGTGRFGGTQPISERRAAISAATGVPTEGVAPPTMLPVHRISLNPDNPRTTLGDLSGLAGSLGEHGQKQAITIMNRDAYVKANPERETELEPDTTHVVVDGSSRLAAAREAGLTHLNVMVDDDQGSDADAILESALVANVHRQDLEPLDEAHALQRLLKIHRTQTALAKRLHKSQGWVSQRLALLNLTSELKERVGQEPVELLRAVGNKPAEQQAAALETLKEEQARAEADRAERKRNKKQGRGRSGPESTPASQNEESTSSGGVTSREAPSGDPESSGSTSSAGEGGQASAAPTSADVIPEPRAGSSATGLPYDDPLHIATHLDRNMEEPDFFELLRLLARHAQERNPDEFASFRATLGDGLTLETN